MMRSFGIKKASGSFARSSLSRKPVILESPGGHPDRLLSSSYRLLRLPVLPLLLFFLLAFTSPAGAALRIGSSLPSVTLSGITGSAVNISEAIREKVTILHFWQIGCSSCRLEIPAMNDLYVKYRHKGLEVLAVNVGQKRETVKSFADDLGVSYQLLIDTEGKSAVLYGVTDVPRTYIIDRQGIIRYRIFGGASSELLKKLILSLF
jgi:cytochrome c biogenesis protein CcmG, thiol:disulfide interchange protein DsbE